jgi:hypothetical protein
MHEHTNAEKKNRHTLLHDCNFRVQKTTRQRSKGLTLAEQLVSYGQHLHERQKLNFWSLATNLAKYRLQPKKSMITVKAMTDILSNNNNNNIAF